ncbi:MAG: hydrogenase formation protein HypD [Desulfurivibrionaceae bacterium]
MEINEVLAKFSDSALISNLLEELKKGGAISSLRIMEVCGTHTMAVCRHGLRSLLPETIDLIAGPGCPVCVTPASHIDSFIDIARHEGVRVATFGDLYRVPGSGESLARASAGGGKVEIVYSPMDALKIAKDNPAELIVFLGVGFETTIPGVAATIQEAARNEIENFAVFSAHKLMPPALEILFSDPSLEIDGLLCPGHVSAIIGTSAYDPLVDKYNLPCVVAGFEPADILQGIIMLARQKRGRRAEVENAYPRAVSREGNKRALAMLDSVFRVCDTSWRGLGVIPASGMAIRPEFDFYNAEKRLDLTIKEVDEPPGCLCGSILKGVCTPPDCPLFGRSCTPVSPVGPCMVSSEGSCAAFYRYGGY